MSIYGRNVRERHAEAGSNGQRFVDVVHLRHDYHRTGGFHTLCGLVDVPGRLSATEDPVTCKTCMAVLEHCLLLAYARGVIRSMPRASTIERARISVDAAEDE